MTLTELRNSFEIKPVTIGESYGWQEEGGCEHCGEPLLVGDSAFEIYRDDDWEEPVVFAVCSRKCARAEIEKMAVAELDMRENY